MKILMTSTSYPSDGADWRGVFIRHLAGGLARLPATELHLWAPPGELPEHVRSANTPEEARWLGELMAAGGVSHLMRERGLRGFAAPLTLLRMLWRLYRRERDIDLYHVNWLQCALPLPSDGKPLVISVLGNDLNLLKVPTVEALLRRTMRGRAVAICPNAEWMVPRLHAAFGDLAEVVPVSFGIDPVWYDIVRQPGDHPNWLAVTRLTANKVGPLFEWSEPLFRNQPRTLHLLGPMQERMTIPEWIQWHGATPPAQLASVWFAKAQGLITLSVHAEGRPQTMLEAQAAGLPIIASDMPAHATVVAHGENGFLCGTPSSYAEAISSLENPETNAAFGHAARAAARTAFGTWDDAARRYATIYARLASRH